MKTPALDVPPHVGALSFQPMLSNTYTNLYPDFTNSAAWSMNFFLMLLEWGISSWAQGTPHNCLREKSSERLWKVAFLYENKHKVLKCCF